MDNCAGAPHCHYMTGITNRFTLPTESGGVTAVAVSSKNAYLLQSAYTLMSTIIVLVGWDLLVAVIATFSSDNSNSSRYVSLVVIWNSNGPAGAASKILGHCRRVLAQRWEKRKSQDLEGLNPEDRRKQNPQHNQGVLSTERSGLDNSGKNIQEQETNGQQPSEGAAGSGGGGEEAGVKNLWWEVLFLFLSGTMWIGSLAAGLFATGGLLIGYCAPVNPNYVSYPSLEILSGNGTGDGYEKFFSLKAPSTLRALGTVESSNRTVTRRIHVERLAPPEGQSASPWAGLSYSYNITGVDMGLQSDPKLTLMVKGSCHTDYTWLVNSTDIKDTYKLWDGNETSEVKYREVLNLPPVADFFIHDPRVLQTDEWPSNISYAVIISIAGHYSQTPSQDPWYATEKSQTHKHYPYRVAPKRPVLSCWETKRWHLNGKEVERTRLGELPGLKLHRFWIGKVFPHEYYLPRVATLGTIAGLSALKSSSSGISLHSMNDLYVLDAGSSGVLDDLERLVGASWVNDKNLLRDTTTYDLKDTENSARRPDGSVEPSVGGFVIESSDVGTLSFRVLISIPVILIFLLLVQFLFTALIKHKRLVTLPSIHELIDKSRTKCNDNHVALGSSGMVVG